MTASPSIRWTFLWIGAGVFWMAVAAFVAVQHRVAGTLLGVAGAPGDPLRTLLSAAAWIPFSVGAVWLAARAPVERDTWTRTLPLHVIAGLLVAVGVNVLMVVLYQLSGLEPRSGAGAAHTALEGVGRWLHVLLLVYGVIVASAQGILHLLRVRHRERDLARARAEVAEARLAALRAQLRPHFLFNALHTLGMLWRLGRGREAQEMLEQVSVLLRRFLEQEKRREVSLAEEVELVEAYLAVEGARFGDRLVVEVAVPAHLRGISVPPLLLQPLVENAVRHGVEGRAGAGRVGIEAAEEGTALVLRVRDDGPGPDHSAPGNGGTGVGLANVRERLRHHYGEGAGLRLERGAEGTGAVATIRIPGIARGSAGSPVQPGEALAGNRMREGT